ncbi:MAG: glycosyltransferase, partial [Mycolicibacterium hassiacum]|uniref:glycosyltransferase n=1 Tax=Mycolicibacterium hassiacum TaxID=46351 RepID=UPI0023F9B253
AFDRTRLSLRALNYLTFLVGALVAGLRAERPDVILCMTDPPMLGALAVLVARRHRAPLVVVSEDVFPEIATELGRLRNPVVVGALRRLVSFYLRRADRIVAIGETMRRRLEAKGAPAERIRVIPNWVDASQLTPRPRDNDWARGNGLAGRFVVMHSGNIGHAQDLDSLVRAAHRLRDVPEIVFVIAGLGARRAEVMQLAADLGLDNVHFLPYQPRERLAESLSSADVHVVGLAPGLAGYVVPSRLYGILAVGRPVIAAVDAESETAQIVVDADCGLRVPPASPDLLAAAIRDCFEGRVDLERLGRNGRAYIEREGDRAIAVGRYRDLIRELVAPVAEAKPIRVLRVIARLNVGGPALHVSYLTRGLAARGYETTLVTGRVGRSEGSMEYVATEAGVEPIYIEALQRNLSLFDDIVALARLVRLIRRFRPDVLHTHTAKAGALGRAAAVLALGARPRVVVHTFHGHVLRGYFPRLATRLFLEVERRLARVSSALIAVSPEVRDDLVELRVAPASKFTVVRLGLDLERRIAAPEGARERVRSELGVGRDQFLVVWLGRMTEIKRVDDLLRIFAVLRRRGVDAVLALVGDGPNRADLQRLADELGVADAVRFAGFRADVGSVFRACDAVALTSANEGTPVSLIEALAAGCAVVTTDVGGARDVVDDGRAGFLVPAGDLDGFADRLEELAGSPELRRRLGEAGRKHVFARYSVDRLVRDIDTLYRELLRDRDRSLPRPRLR